MDAIHLTTFKNPAFHLRKSKTFKTFVQMFVGCIAIIWLPLNSVHVHYFVYQGNTAFFYNIQKELISGDITPVGEIKISNSNLLYKREKGGGDFTYPGHFVPGALQKVTQVMHANYMSTRISSKHQNPRPRGNEFYDDSRCFLAHPKYVTLRADYRVEEKNLKNDAYLYINPRSRHATPEPLILGP